MSGNNPYYVTEVTSKGLVVGYGVNDSVYGMESQHSYFPVEKYGDAKARKLANQRRDELNKRPM